MKKITAFVPQARKALVALAGAGAEALTLGLVPAPYAKFVSEGIALLTTAGIYVVANAAKPA